MTTQASLPIETRVSRLEGAYEQVNERLGGLAQSVSDLHREIRTLYLFIGGSWVTLMATMIGLYVAG